MPILSLLPPHPQLVATLARHVRAAADQTSPDLFLQQHPLGALGERHELRHGSAGAKLLLVVVTGARADSRGHVCGE